MVLGAKRLGYEAKRPGLKIEAERLGETSCYPHYNVHEGERQYS